MPLDVAAMVKALLGAGSLKRFHKAHYANLNPILTHLSPREPQTDLRAWLRSKERCCSRSGHSARLETSYGVFPISRPLAQKRDMPFAALTHPNLSLNLEK